MPLLAMCQPAVLFQFYLAFCRLISNTLPSTSVYLFCIRSANASLYVCMPDIYKICLNAFNNLSDHDNRYRKFPLMDNVMLFMCIFEKQHCLLCVKS